MNLIDFIIILILSAAIWLTAFAVKKGSIWKYVFGAAFTVYLMCAASITVFPIQFSPTIRAIFAEEGWKITDCIVLVPFKDGITADDILNAAMTVPFGVLITLIRKKTTWKNALAAGAAFGTATELLQLAIAAIQGVFVQVYRYGGYNLQPCGHNARVDAHCPAYPLFAKKQAGERRGKIPVCIHFGKMCEAVIP